MATKNIAGGSAIGWGVEKAHKHLLPEGQMPKDFYIRQRDLDSLENTFKENDKRVGEIQEANKAPYGD